MIAKTAPSHSQRAAGHEQATRDRWAAGQFASRVLRMFGQRRLNSRRVLARVVLGSVILPSFSSAVSAAPDLPLKKLLTLEVANRMADASQAAAEKRKSAVVIAVVDDGGYPILLRRLNDTQVASVQVAIDKARTAAIFRRPSKVFEDQVKNGRVSAIALAGAVPLQGGLPITLDGVVIGAISASGNTPQEDEDIAAAGLAAFNTSLAVRYFPVTEVAAAFAKGALLVETPNYKVIASRRAEPGLAEVHLYETDVIHVLQGSATFVTGGSVIEPKVDGPGEIRGHAIEGGTVYLLKPGDVIVVPAGTPHWFRAVDGQFLYYVVKPISK